MKTHALLALATFAGLAQAEPTYVTIPDQGWHVSIDAPAPTTVQGKTVGSRFSYIANDQFSQVTYSINTEPVTGGTNQGCRETFRGRSKNLPPHLKEHNVELFDTPSFAGVKLRFELDKDGQKLSTASANAIFAVKDRCVDVHVSQFPYSDEAMANIEKIVRSVRVVR